MLSAAQNRGCARTVTAAISSAYIVSRRKTVKTISIDFQFYGSFALLAASYELGGLDALVSGRSEVECRHPDDPTAVSKHPRV